VLNKIVRMCWCEVTCSDYEASGNHSVVSQTNDTVELECRGHPEAGRTWTVSCVDGEWVGSDAVDCTRNSSTNANKSLLVADDIETDHVHASLGTGI